MHLYRFDLICEFQFSQIDEINRRNKNNINSNYCIIIIIIIFIIFYYYYKTRTLASEGVDMHKIDPKIAIKKKSVRWELIPGRESVKRSLNRYAISANAT